MREFKKGKLNIGKSKKKVKNRKQAIAIALNEAGIKQKKEDQMIDDIKWKLQEWWDETTKKTKIIIAVGIIIVINHH